MQTDSLHSGSISFGRFENEPLCWERRSSFSHNRYLEEVEKCSKPGSVTEKKAYFEAHFRRKALQLQGSSECQNDGECQTGENDVLDNDSDSRDEFDIVIEARHSDQLNRNGLENMDYREEFCNGNDGSPDNRFHEIVFESVNYSQEYYNVNEGSQSDYVIETSQFTHFDESPRSCEYHGESADMECDREESSLPPYASQTAAAFENADVMLDYKDKHEEAHQIETDSSHSRNSELKIESENCLKEHQIDINAQCKPAELCPSSEITAESNNSSSERRGNLSPKVWIYSFLCSTLDIVDLA